MAIRRSVAARAKLFYQQQRRVAVPLSHIDRHDDGDSRRQIYLCRRDNVSGSSNLFRDRRFSIPAAYAPIFARNMSSRGEGESWDDNVEIMNHEAADLLGENAVDAVVAPAANEVAAAAANCVFPVDALLYSIDYLHSFTGMNWWASIAVTSVLIRTILLPIEIRQMRAISNFNLLRQEMEETNSNMNASEWSTARKRKLLEKSTYAIANPSSMVLVAIPLAVSTVALFNMVREVASLKDGGAFWFTDLTTSDPIFILPCLTAFTLWIALESHAEILPESNPKYKRKAQSYRAFSATLALPFAACFPKAILCFWITSNLYSIACGKVMQVPKVKMMLGVPPSYSKDFDQTLLLLPTMDKYLAMTLSAYLTMTMISGGSLIS